MANRGPDWKWIRSEAIIRDNYTCQECGNKGGRKGSANLEVHHRTPVSEGGTDELDNLVTLCKICHKKEHGKPVDVSDRILEVMDLCEPYTAGEVADEIETTRRTADRRLRELAESGDVRRKKHSERRVSWWIDEE